MIGLIRLLLPSLVAPRVPFIAPPRVGLSGGSRRRRLATRTVPAIALLIGSAVMLPLIVLRPGRGARRVVPALPSSPVGVAPVLRHATIVSPLARRRDVPVAIVRVPAPVVVRRHLHRAAAVYPAIHWHHSQALGVPHNGHLVDGVAFPVAGPDWATWDPTVACGTFMQGDVYPAVPADSGDSGDTGETAETDTNRPRTWRYQVLGPKADPYTQMIGGELIVSGRSSNIASAGAGSRSSGGRRSRPGSRPGASSIDR